MSGQSQQRLDSQPLFDYIRLGQDMALNIAINCSDTKHNQFDNHCNWGQIRESLVKDMTDLVRLEQHLKHSVEASVKTEEMIQQLISADNDSDNPLDDKLVDQLFEENVEKIKAENDINVEDNESYKKLMEVLNEFSSDLDTNETNSEDNEDLVTFESQTESIPIDPFSKKPIDFPVKNKKCKHIYDREQLKLILEGKGTTGRQRCPIVGCGNRSVTMADVVEDRKTKALIDRLKRNEN